MDRAYSSRNNESDMHLRQENAQLKRELAALQQALHDDATNTRLIEAEGRRDLDRGKAKPTRTPTNLAANPVL